MRPRVATFVSCPTFVYLPIDCIMELPTDRLLAYVFWHWPSTEIDAPAYESRQRHFHHELRAAPPSGFRGSISHAVHDVPWAGGGSAAYEDWYHVDDFASLSHLNDAAVSASRAASHARAAAHAAGGTAGVLGLRLGRAAETPVMRTWFAKPSSMSYADLFGRLAADYESFDGGLWMRQMTLGPGTEFCLSGAHHAPPAEMLSVRQVALRSVWTHVNASRE